MHDLLDDYAHTNALRDVSPRLKLMFGLGSILLCVYSPSPVAPLLAALTMSATTILLAKIPWRLYCKLLIVPLTFVLLSSLAILFVGALGEPIVNFQVFGLGLDIGRESANIALLMLSRTLGGTSSLFFIALTTPMVEIFSILKSLRLPDVLLELSMLIYRYIFVLMDQAILINSAQTMRLGHANLRSSFGSFSMLTGVLFLRAWEQGERLMVAMDSRCYDGRLNVFERRTPVAQQDALAVFSYLAAVATIAFLTRDIRLI
jgi:cobalt/nickel transport system permease protein